MGRPDFETYRKALRGLGFHEADSRYDEAVFGSWLIVFDDPRARVVWDGHDGSLEVQRKTPLHWTDAWISFDRASQTPEIVAAQLALLGRRSRLRSFVYRTRFGLALIAAGAVFGYVEFGVVGLFGLPALGLLGVFWRAPFRR